MPPHSCAKPVPPCTRAALPDRPRYDDARLVRVARDTRDNARHTLSSLENARIPRPRHRRKAKFEKLFTVYSSCRLGRWFLSLIRYGTRVVSCEPRSSCTATHGHTGPVTFSSIPSAASCRVTARKNVKIFPAQTDFSILLLSSAFYRS